jgi:hypothetical protein
MSLVIISFIKLLYYYYYIKELCFYTFNNSLINIILSFITYIISTYSIYYLQLVILIISLSNSVFNIILLLK